MLGLGSVLVRVQQMCGHVMASLKCLFDFEDMPSSTGSNLIRNGSFTHGLGGLDESDDHSLTWLREGGVTVQGNGVNLNNVGLTKHYVSIMQLGIGEIGKSYRLTYDVTETNGKDLILQQSSDITMPSASIGTKSITFEWTSSESQIHIKREVAETNVTINNLILVELSQSVRNKAGNSNNLMLYTGKALSFDGVGDKVDCGNAPFDINVTAGKWTVAAWIKVNDTTADQCIFNNGLDGSNRFGISVYAGYVWVNYYNGPIVGYVNERYPISSNAWHRVVGIIQDGSLSVYVDGTAGSSSWSSGGQPYRYSIGKTIGHTGSSEGANYKAFNGEISDVQVWDTAWDLTDIFFDWQNPQHLTSDRPQMGSNSPLPLSNLKGWWHLSEGAGSTAYDNSGEGNDGTVTGAIWEAAQSGIPQLGLMDWAKSTVGSDDITLIADPNNPSQDILGNSVRLREHGLNLDGTGYAEVGEPFYAVYKHAPGVESFNSNSTGLHMSTGFTVSLWKKMNQPLSGPIAEVFVSKGSGLGSGVKSAFQLSQYYGNGYIYFDINTEAGRTACTSPLAYAYDGSWKMFTATYDGAEQKLYVDGAIVKTTATLGSDIYEGYPLRVGTNKNSAYYCPSIIDEVEWHDECLEADAIESIYQDGLEAHSVDSDYSDDYSEDYGHGLI